MQNKENHACLKLSDRHRFLATVSLTDKPVTQLLNGYGFFKNESVFQNYTACMQPATMLRNDSGCNNLMCLCSTCTKPS